MSNPGCMISCVLKSHFPFAILPFEPLRPEGRSKTITSIKPSDGGSSSSIEFHTTRLIDPLRRMIHNYVLVYQQFTCSSSFSKLLPFFSNLNIHDGNAT